MIMSKTTKPKLGCFITARTSSTRLPQKMLLPIRGKTVIEHDIDRAKLVKGVDFVVLCTSDGPEDNVLEEIAKKQGIDFYRGSLKDIIARWLEAATKFNLDYFVEFDGDDLFCDPELLSSAVVQMLKEPCDLLKPPADLVCGGAGYCISVPALKKVYDIKGTDDVDFWPVYFTDTSFFKVRDLKIEDPTFKNLNIRLTLDYPDDLEFFERVFDELDTNTNDVSLRQILGLLNQKPEIAKINFFRQQEFADNQKIKAQLVLKDNKVILTI